MPVKTGISSSHKRSILWEIPAFAGIDVSEVDGTPSGEAAIT
jgi:hypothetical protein